MADGKSWEELSGEQFENLDEEERAAFEDLRRELMHLM